MLRRVRETGDALLLRMLIDLYGLVQLDATFGVSTAALSQNSPVDYPARKVFEIGVHSIWALRLNGGNKSAAGEWVSPHCLESSKNEDCWVEFWSRIELLEKIGALWYEAWIFDSEDADAEPLFPVDLGAIYYQSSRNDVSQLTYSMREAAATLSEGRNDLISRYSNDILVTFAQHRRSPSIRGVAKMKIEADTPGRRLSYYKRCNQIDIYKYGFEKIVLDSINGEYNIPMNTSISKLR